MTDGTRSWIGHREDGEGGGDDAVLVLRPDGVGLSLSIGTIWSDGIAYEVRRVATNVVAVVDLAPDAFVTNDLHVATPPGDGEPDTEPMTTVDPLGRPPANYDPNFEGVADSDAEATSGADAYVDVLVLYTPAAAAASSDVLARIKQYVSNANAAMANDHLSPRFRLVRVQRYEFVERASNASADLDTISSSSVVTSLRGDYAADLVAVVGTGWAGGSNVCGLGYQPDGWSSGYKSYGYSIWDVSASRCDSVTGAHEMGHNLTLRHDWANDDKLGAGSPFSPAYNHGYTSMSPTNGFRTVMSYPAAGCSPCTAIPYWSNPNATYNGAPRGSSLTGPTPAYDAKGIATSAPHAAKWLSDPNPFGAFDSVTDYPNGIRVKGWAVDPDRRTTGLTVEVLVDGAVVKTGTANLYNSYVATYHPSYGGDHGYDVTAPASGGTHSVCVRARNVAYGTVDTQLGSCKSITLKVDPVGAITTVSRVPGGAKVSGWALDPDVSSAINVYIKVDGVTHVIMAANQSSPDAPSTWADWGGSHGWSATLTISSEVTHDICVVGANAGEGADATVDCRTVTFSGDPSGSFQSALREAGGVEIIGWAFDPDTTASIQVRASVDGVVKATATASYYDSAIDAAYPAYGGWHTYIIGLPAMSEGSHSICVTALNVAGGANTSLGCKTFTYLVDPVGAFTVTRTAANAVEVTGWALDPDTVDAIDITVSVGSVGSAYLVGPHVTADQYSTAVGSAYVDNYGRYHGFTTNTVVGVGTQDVCVRAYNVGTGVDQVLGCKTV